MVLECFKENQWETDQPWIDCLRSACLNYTQSEVNNLNLKLEEIAKLLWNYVQSSVYVSQMRIEDAGAMVVSRLI